MLYPQDEEPTWRYNKQAIIGGVLLSAALLGVAGSFVYREFFTSRESPVVSPSITEVKINDAPTNVVGRYLFNGTTVWARAVEKYAYGNYAQPFSQLQTLDRSAYDGWSTDLECPITDGVVPYQTQIDHLVFNCRPEFLAEANKYFNLYDLANNHTDNQGGQEGIRSTRAYLEKSGAQYFGNYDPTITSDICEVIALPVRIKRADKTEEPGQLPVAFCAWHFFNYFRGPKPEELAVVQKYAQKMPVLGFVEMGAEYRAAASADQVAIAHQLIDAGLDVLIANNPHWVQNTEVYKGKLIVYSLGNFIFDQLDTETQRGVSVDLSVNLSYDQNLQKWLALEPACKAFQDDCLSKSESQQLKKITPTFVFGVVASQGGAGKITRKADAATQAAVEERMNWAATLKALGQ